MYEVYVPGYGKVSSLTPMTPAELRAQIRLVASVDGDAVTEADEVFSFPCDPGPTTAEKIAREV